MPLESVQVGEENDSSLVVPRRRAEHEPAQRHRGRQHSIVRRQVAASKRNEGGRGGAGDRVEYAEKSVAVAAGVALDQIRIVEIVAGVHFDPDRQTAARPPLLGVVEQRDLHAVDLGRVDLDDREGSFERRLELGVSPIILQCRIEHVAEPVQYRGPVASRKRSFVDLLVIGGRLGDVRERATRH
jgi:hypothetical protein